MLYSIFSVVSVCAVISPWLKRNQTQYLLFLLIFLCFVLSFIRWNTGTDWESYYDIFISSKNLSNYTSVEPTFFLLNHICYSLTTSYTFCLLIESLILFGCSYYIVRQQKYPLLTYFLLFASTLGNIMFVRQSISVAIVLFSYQYILSGNKRKFYICIICATLLHTSSIVALPIYWLYRKGIKWRILLLILFIVFLCSMFLNGNLFRNVLSTDYFIGAKIIGYLNRSENGVDMNYITITPQKAIMSHLLKRLFIIGLLLTYCRGTKITDKKLNGYLRIYLYSSVLYFIVTPLSMDLSRVCTCLELVDIFLYPYIFSTLKRTSSKIITLFLILIFGLSKFISNYNRFPEIFGSYITIFQ